ncbi:hypothetical protein D3C81_2136290 [compost metagenome]
MDHDIGSGLDARIAGSQQELDVVAVVFHSEALHGLYYTAQGVGLVVGEVGIDGQQAAVFVV